MELKKVYEVNHGGQDHYFLNKSDAEEWQRQVKCPPNDMCSVSEVWAVTDGKTAYRVVHLTPIKINNSLKDHLAKHGRSKLTYHEQVALGLIRDDSPSESCNDYPGH